MTRAETRRQSTWATLDRRSTHGQVERCGDLSTAGILQHQQIEQSGAIGQQRGGGAGRHPRLERSLPPLRLDQHRRPDESQP